jgi:hypothetical protein
MDWSKEDAVNIRALMIAAFGSILVLAGCAAPPPTPVLIATWVAQGIPSDLVIEYSGTNGVADLDLDVRIKADGSTTYHSSTYHRLTTPGQHAGKLTTDALKRVVLAFEEKRFFYLEEAGNGCIVDTTRRPIGAQARTVTDIGEYSISIRINGMSKQVSVRDCLMSPESANVGWNNFYALTRILEDAVDDLPPVTPTDGGAAEPGPAATPSGAGG